MTDSQNLLRKLPNDLGGAPAGIIEQTDHVLEPWEKRRGVEALGAEMVGKLSYYERWIATFATILFQKEILTPDELARKMDEIEARGRLV